VARALVNDAPIILADEPTGNLDTKTSAEIMELFTKLNAESNITIILITHEADIAAYSRRIIKFRDGCIISDDEKGFRDQGLGVSDKDQAPNPKPRENHD
ncbi:MAG: macrolide ABC transporter ATP-binding protein, partial [Thermodesulfovibrionales bacterium]|nr:macrolide ABC transporter ATP-binding protein [Thermodesulfovibrionales bacterium]